MFILLLTFPTKNKSSTSEGGKDNRWKRSFLETSLFLCWLAILFKDSVLALICSSENVFRGPHSDDILRNHCHFDLFVPIWRYKGILRFCAF